MSQTTECHKLERNGSGRAFESATPLRPHVDVVDNPDGVLVYVEMPGVDHEHVEVTVEVDRLTIEGWVEFTVPEGFQPVSGNFNSRLYRRAFHLSKEIDRERISAEVKNGVMTLTLPKLQEAQPQKITVKQA